VTIKVVVDTNVLVVGLISGKGANRQILRLCLQGILQPFIGNALYLEYLDVLNRTDIQNLCQKTSSSLSEFLDDFASVCKAVDAHCLWRPNLKDEADNHLIEFAIAADATYIITNNIKNFTHPELKQLGYDVTTPA